MSPIRMQIIALMAGVCWVAVQSDIVPSARGGNAENSEEFVKWAESNSFHYAAAPERRQRARIFEENRAIINKHNNDPSQLFKLAFNYLTDKNSEEFQQNYLGRAKGRGHILQNPGDPLTTANGGRLPDATPPPESLDWRTAGAVTSVKNQGRCGSCWAFSAVGALESRYFILHNKSATFLRDLSEQQLVECSRAIGNLGCSGGLAMWAYQYVLSFGGLNLEGSYKYLGRDRRRCYAATTEKQKHVKLTGGFGYVRPTADDDSALIQALQTGPVSVSIAVSQNRKFQSYASGVFTCAKRPTYDELDHEMLAVGYTATYWIIKNSWGTGWGQKGYVFIQRNATDPCGILVDPVYPALAPV